MIKVVVQNYFYFIFLRKCWCWVQIFILRRWKKNYMYIFCIPSHGVQICGTATENLRLQLLRDISKTLERRRIEWDSSPAPFSLFLASTLCISFSITSFPSTNHYLILSQKRKNGICEYTFWCRTNFLDFHACLKSSRTNKKTLLEITGL